jgi:hypothetical protein
MKSRLRKRELIVSRRTFIYSLARIIAIVDAQSRGKPLDVIE